MTNRLHLKEGVSHQLDSLRGFAALIVLVGHTNQVLIDPISSLITPLCGLLAQSGVMLFFALSGWLIGKSIACNILRYDGLFDFRAYIFDRFIRIFPTLVASLLLLVILCEFSPKFFNSGSNLFV